MATLKISDLSIGDWVKDKKGNYAKVIGIENCINGYFLHIELPGVDIGVTALASVHPIHITPKILEANGLFRHEVDTNNPEQVVLSNYFMMARTHTDVDWWRVLIYDEEMPSRELFNGRVYYVHQLQHALRLAGVEKEIVMPNK